MSKLQKHRSLITLIFAVVVLTTALVAVFWARGFKPDLRNGRIGHTGLIVATSVPTGAQVYLDDRLTGATDTNLTYLDPRTYKVRIQKDGYTTWEKQIEIRADLAAEIKAVLFPLAPQISPLTATGAAHPAISPDGTKIIYGVPGDRGGLVLLSLGTGPFVLGQSNKSLAKNQAGYDFSRATFIFSPDAKQAIATFKNDAGEPIANLLVETDKSQQELRDITGSLSSQLNSWQEEINTRAQAFALTIPENIKAATASAQAVTPTPNPTLAGSQQPVTSNQSISIDYYPTGIIPSPDEDKILYKDKAGKYKVYDQKLKKVSNLPDFSDLINITWFPDSEHLLVAQKNGIAIVETDGQNKMVVYSGKYEGEVAFVNPSGSKLIILTTLAQPDGTPPNLYAINLK